MGLAAINVGIVGYGYSGSVIHPALLRRVDGLELCAVATRDEAARAAATAKLGVKTFGSLAEMLGHEQVELVVIATPHDTHEELVLQALRAKRHVVCEKVLALSAASADRMIAAAAASGRIFSVFHNRRWDGDFLTVKRAIEESMVGAPRFIEAAVHVAKRPRSWRNDPERCGGLLFDWGSHLIDQLLLLVAAPVTSVSGFSLRAPDGREVYARCQLRFATGQVGCAEVSYASLLSRPRWFVLGDIGTLSKDGIDPQETSIRSGDARDATDVPAHRARVRSSTNGLVIDSTLETLAGDWAAFYQNLRDAIRLGAPLVVQPEQARGVVAILEAHARAARTGQEVSL